MMKTMKWTLMAALAASCWAGSVRAADDDLFARAPWFGTVGLNWYETEGDWEMESGLGLMGKVGYSFNAWWDLEAGLNFMPSLSARDQDDLNVEALDGSTTALRLSLEGLLHLRALENRRIDPFLFAGPAVTFFGDDVENGQTQLGLFGGAGVFYHFNDSWALRADVAVGVQGKNSETPGLFEMGVTYRFGATKRIAPQYVVAEGGDIDSDGDGLYDKDEAVVGTDPYNPDTDGDGLSDGDEHFGRRGYNTDPLNPDSDWDGLKDGAEVLTYKTNPLDPDTDKGGVTDGHEVIEDSTNPLDPSDDLQKFTLLIEFDYDKSFIRPQYHKDLEPVVKVLQRSPDATVRVEGHADKRKRSTREYNQKLSERRANAVKDYLVQKSGISAANVTAVGYGFDRPVALNDTEANMQKNRRTDIYIKKGGPK